MSFFTFNQNNSGGKFDFDEERGISHWVIIEAPDKAAAIARAESIGLYFDGAGDCPCCGHRWSTYTDDESDTPKIYDEPAADFIADEKWLWMAPRAEAFIHYADGRKAALLGKEKA
jgi:hypothetical protein